MRDLQIDGHSLSLDSLREVARQHRQTLLLPEARQRMLRSQEWVQGAAEGKLGGAAVYGVNTGFGSLARIRIPEAQTQQLSRNLIRSHAAGVGAAVPEDVARGMMLLRANALAQGASGCRPVLVERLLELLNHRVYPKIPQQGSCGSSGDLAPLAHLGLILTHLPEDPLEETGEAWLGGELLWGRVILERLGLEAIRPAAKDGLALTNGAQLTTSYACLACLDAQDLVLYAELAAAMSLEALRGVTRAFHPLVHERRPYPGAQACAANLLRLTEGSGWTDTQAGHIQDAYSLRCTPQVLGASRDALGFVARQLSIEINAVTDNPLILLDAPSDNKAYSAGMFHGEPVGMASDFMKIAVAEVASLSERRLFRLLSSHLSGKLPPSLSRKGGIGLFALQTTAASLVSENKALAWPASVDSIPTCEDQEDHVAMSTTAARRASEVVQNSRQVVAIELLVAMRALQHRLAREDRPLGKGSSAAMELLEERLRPGSPSEQCAQILELMDSRELIHQLSAAGLSLIPAREEA